jgi:hypothetical protein
MSQHDEILETRLTNFAGLTEKDLAAGRSFWRLRKLKKGEFFNMQYVVCNDLGLVVKGIRKSIPCFISKFCYPNSLSLFHRGDGGFRDRLYFLSRSLQLIRNTSQYHQPHSSLSYFFLPGHYQSIPEPDQEKDTAITICGVA